MLCVWDDDFYGMLEVEFWVDGLDVELLKTFDRSENSHVPVLLLVVDILDDKAYVSLYVMVRAYVFTDL